MSDTLSPERTYKHKVPAEVFIEAFTTIEWTSEQTEKFNALGIERLKGSELKKKNRVLNKYYYKDKEEFTLIVNAEITGNIAIANYTGILPNWCIYQSKLTNVILRHCQWGEANTETKKLTHGTFFSLIDSSTGGIVIRDKSCIGFFDIANSTTGDFNIWDNSTTGNFTIWDNSSTGDFRVYNSSIGDFTIWDKSTIGDFSISNSVTGDFSIWSKNTTRDFSIENSTTGDFRIWDKNTIGDFHIENSIMGDFSISTSTAGCFSIYKSSSPNWEMISLFSSFHFSKATIGQCRLIDCRIPELTIQNESSIELYVSEGKINHLNLEQLTLGKSSVVSLSNTLIYACNMHEFAMLGNLYLRGVKRANDVYIWPDIESTLHKKYTSDGIRKESNNYKWTKEILEDQYTKHIGDSKKLTEKFASATFLISQSSLGKTEFTNCDLEGFNFEFNNSKITEVFISGGTLPININVFEETDKLKILEQQKSFFDQLKKVFEGQGDIVRGTKYHALASEKQMEIIEAEKGMWSSEWWVYWLNKKSNKHGESWWQAVQFIVYVSVPIYCFYCFSTPQFSFQGNWDWKLFGDFLGYYFSFLLPTHKVDFIPDVKQNVGTLFFDFFGRIAIGYGIYQLISAFRKHGKKA